MFRFDRGDAAIAAAALLSHVACLRAGFIWLDHAHLEEGLALSQGAGWLALFTHGFAGTGYYRPLMSLSLSLDRALGGTPLIYHATTLLWHGAAAIMLRIAGQELGLSRRAAVFAALLFAVHPLNSLVANAIAFRSEAMIAVSLLAVITWHLRGSSWAAAGALFAGALSKETALVLGPLLVCALEAFVPRAATRKKSQRIALCGVEALGLGLALVLRLTFAPKWRAHFPALSLDEAIGTRLASVTKSVRAVLLPIEGGVCDAFAISGIATPSALTGLSALAILGYLCWRRRVPAILLILALLPSLQLVPVARWWSPHYLYLPLAFASLLVVQAIESRSDWAMRWLAPLSLALGGLSALEARRYEHDERFWSKEVRLDPACREGHFYLAEAALAARRLDVAADHYERALEFSPGILSYVDLPAALQNLGVVRLQQRRFADASEVFRRALNANLDAATKQRLRHNLSVAELLGRRAEAAGPEEARDH